MSLQYQHAEHFLECRLQAIPERGIEYQEQALE